MHPSLLAGRIDGPVPLVSYDAARDQILRTHTDLVTAQNAVAKAQYQLKLARVTPICPNIDTNTVIEHDYTTPPSVQSPACKSAFLCRSSTTTAATSSRLKQRWFERAANMSGHAMTCSPTWLILLRFRPIAKRPNSITTAFSSTKSGPIGAFTSVTRSIRTPISTTW